MKLSTGDRRALQSFTFNTEHIGENLWCCFSSLGDISGKLVLEVYVAVGIVVLLELFFAMLLVHVSLDGG